MLNKKYKIPFACPLPGPLLCSEVTVFINPCSSVLLHVALLAQTPSQKLPDKWRCPQFIAERTKMHTSQVTWPRIQS